jgi:tetratricopeptide (TPR) repeat protein
MTATRLPTRIIVLLLFVPGLTSTLAADMFDNPQNLQALPKDISPAELRSTMRSFALSTGSRCSACHVYEDEANFETYDFTADDKQKKQTARQMIRMVADINSRIQDIQGKPEADLVSVTCATCHRDQDKPRMLPDVIEHTYKDDSLEAAMDQYRELRDQYYGGYVFDFSPRSLEELSERLAAVSDYPAALALLDLNLEFNPEYARGYAMKADVQMRAGDKAAARESLLKAIEIAPDDQWYKMMLQRMDES